MLIPYSTDAPVYHFPYATLSMIVINVVMFLAFCLHLHDEDATEISHFEDPQGRRYDLVEIEARYDELEEAGEDPSEFFESLTPVVRSTGTSASLMLEFGKLRPWQWLTSMFMHADVVHLVGNMMFLWAFGLVIEGKVGPVVFSSLYLAMGMVQAVVVQLLMVFSDGAALGASGAIFSLLALVLLFAPVNSFETILLIGRGALIEIPILVFCGIYLAMNVAFFFIGGAQMSSEALHLAGFLVGLPVGLTMLKQGYVDCEGYDLISYWSGKLGKRSTIGKRERRDRERMLEEAEEAKLPQQDPEQTKMLLASQVAQLASEEQWDAAVALQRKLAQNHAGLGWDQRMLAAIIQGYLKQQRFREASTLLDEHIRAFAHRRSAMQILLLKVWLREQRPRQVLRYIEGLNPAFLAPEDQQQLPAIAAHAQKLIASGVMELS